MLVDIISIIAMILLGAFVMLTALYLAVAIRKNIRVGQQFRKNFAIKLTAYRLHKMLSALGITQDEYLHQQPITKIMQNMENCQQCPNHKRCDTELDKNKTVLLENIEFCPNETSLRQVQVATE